MTTERDYDPGDHDSGATLIEARFEDIDPEQTLAGEDWETAVIRRIAPRVAAVQSAVEDAEDRFGWETEGLRRLSQKLAFERGE